MRISVSAVLVLGALCSLGRDIRAQSTTRASVSSQGVEGNLSATLDDISDDGNFVSFTSQSSNLIFGDGNNRIDVFVYSRVTRTTTRVSVGTGGAEGNNHSGSSSASADGRWIAFVSTSSNLVAGGTSFGLSHVFIRDTVADTTGLVTMTAGGVQGNNHSSTPSISGDARFIAFASLSSNLIVGDTNGQNDVFVRDSITGNVSRVSVDDAGIQAIGASHSPSISPDGRFVAFLSDASNLVVGDTNATNDVFVHDRFLATTTRVSVSNSGMQVTGTNERPWISSGGRFVAFSSTAPTLVNTDANAVQDAFVRDLLLGTTTRISVSNGGAELSVGGRATSISADARFVSFVSSSASVVLGDTNGQPDLFIHDRTTQGVDRASVATGGFQANGASNGGVLSGDGSFFAFESGASNLVAFDANGFADAFVSDRTIFPFALYCSGDGTATACPCGNASAYGSDAGCLNSGGVGGRLRASGSVSVSNDTVVLAGSDMRNGPCLYIQGSAAFNSGFGAVFGDGLRCAAGAVIRLGILVNVAGNSQYPGPSDQPVSIKGACAPGDVRTYQIWYRDAQPFCAPETYNLTNGVAFAWRP